MIFLIVEEFGLPETALRNALETGHYRNKVRSDFIGRGDTASRRLRFVAGIQARLAADSSDRSAEEAEHRSILCLKKAPAN